MITEWSPQFGTVTSHSSAIPAALYSAQLDLSFQGQISTFHRLRRLGKEVNQVFDVTFFSTTNHVFQTRIVLASTKNSPRPFLSKVVFMLSMIKRLMFYLVLSTVMETTELLNGQHAVTDGTIITPYTMAFPCSSAPS
jgi:hypothetical protein